MIGVTSRAGLNAATSDGFGEAGGPCAVIAGPTASGKSALAVSLAQRCGGEIVNADSMQVYRDLSILTARPTSGDCAAVPHHLYGILAPGEICGAGIWLAWLHRLLPEIWGRGRVPVIVGGTGLYLRALIDGLAPVPEVPPEIRAAVSADYDRRGAAAFAADLSAVDPRAAAAIPAANRQRMIRAMEVFRATGRPITAWHDEPHRGGLPQKPLAVAILPERTWLYDRCDRRFVAMLASGAWEQVAALAATGIAADAPVWRALGARAMHDALSGVIGRDEAVERGQRETRNYAKRQLTWFRGQLAADVTLRPPADSVESAETVESLAARLAAAADGGHNSLRPSPEVE